MANVTCEECNHLFDPTNHLVTSGSAVAGAAAGAAFGARLGIAGGPWGAIAGTIPGAIIGGALAGLGATKITKCPSCDKVFTI